MRKLVGAVLLALGVSGCAGSGHKASHPAQMTPAEAERALHVSHCRRAASNRLTCRYVDRGGVTQTCEVILGAGDTLYQCLGPVRRRPPAAH
jgi:hypothetical protein